jgi:tryptophan synthase alpha chain
MNRIEEVITRRTAEGRKALVGYLTAGDPDPEGSFTILRAACAAGLDVLELGVPFSDPTSDGPVIQAAAQRALKAGMTLTRALDMARRLRAEVATPMVLFSYYNPLLRYGLERLARDARAAGIDGLLVVDLPPEEAGELAVAAGQDLPLIRLVAPTTGAERMRAIVQGAGGFLYLITRTGVTGKGHLDRAALQRYAAELRSVARLPICLGFGIRTPEDARELAPLADGIIVGSELVQTVADAPNATTAAEQVAAKVRALRMAL